MTPLSLTARISLLFAAAAALVLLIAGVFIYRAVEMHFVEEDRHELQGKVELIRHLLAKAHSSANLDALAQELDDALVGHHDLSVAVVNAQGEIWFATSGADFPRPLLSAPASTAGALKEWIQKGISYRGMAVPVAVGYPHPVTYIVATALDISHHLVFLADFRRMLILAMALAAVTTAALGWAVARQGLAPLRKLTAMAASISANRLGERLHAPNVPTELQELVATFNAMLERLEGSFRRLSDFSSDIAHELRTPVSNLLTQTQVVLSQARNTDEYREILHSNLEEFDRLARMIGDMLFLAKADNRLVVPRRERVDVAQEVRGLFEFYDAMASEAGVSLKLRGNGAVDGDRLMIQRAISNLLANAILHTPKGGSVSVSVEEGKDLVTLAMENPAPEVPPQELDRLFDRFFRLDPSRRKNTGEGAGLGLAITKSIVKAHGGRVEATWAKGQIRFSLQLPVSGRATQD
jgi:two-component system, OmpR family, heavy metal sensor histidine kinase CusS